MGAAAPLGVVLDVLALVVRALSVCAVRMHAALAGWVHACARFGQVAQDEGKGGQGHGTRLVNELKVPAD